MTRDQLTDRVLELFPPMAEVEPWRWGTTDENEPVVVIENNCSFTGLDTGEIDLTAPVPNTSMVGVWRIDTDNHYELKGMAEDPLAEAVQQAQNN